jgi:hypothetical protein
MTTKQPPEISEAAVKTGVQKAHLRWDRVLIGGFLAADSVHGRGVHARAHPQDSHRHPDKRRCCALGRCCHTTVSPRTLSDIRGCLRAALAQAVTEEIISRNVAAAVKLPKVRSRATRRQAWSSEEARVFFESPAPITTRCMRATS